MDFKTHNSISFGCLFIIICGLLLACGKPDKLSQTTSNSLCTSCHGSVSTNSAPPNAINGASTTTDIAVGAHQAHLSGSDISDPVACTECHLVPAAIDDTGHIDSSLPAEVVFGALATTSGVAPNWNGASCSNVYCHGASLSGGTHTEPIWTLVDGTQSTCASCHGLPPAAPHPQQTDCATCHSQVVNSDGSFVDRSLHINGNVETDTLIACNSCHGSSTNDAPNSGAHQSHLLAGTISSALSCSSCHTVPAAISANGHIDGDGVAEVIFSGLAIVDNTAPTWNGTSCSNSYCHGATLSGGSLTSPVWSTVNGSQAACGTCHGLPPGPPHPIQDNCENCHSAVVDATGNIINTALHIDGNVDLDSYLPCNGCHGSATNNAPPFGLNGETATSTTAVGAHQSHLQALSDITLPVSCDTCHLVPAVWSETGHIDAALPAEVIFSGLAVAASHTPTWNGTTCNNSYCHNPKLTDTAPGLTTTPNWTQVDGTQNQCTSCHGYPPQTGGVHPAFSFCSGCHDAVVDDDDITIINKSRHMNGVIDFHY